MRPQLYMSLGFHHWLYLNMSLLSFFFPGENLLFLYVYISIKSDTVNSCLSAFGYCTVHMLLMDVFLLYWLAAVLHVCFLMEIGLLTKLLRAETLAHSFTLETYLLKRCPRAIKLTVEFFLPVSVFPYYDWKVNLLCDFILSPLCSKDFVYIQSFNKYLFSN